MMTELKIWLSTCDMNSEQKGTDLLLKTILTIRQGTILTLLQSLNALNGIPTGPGTVHVTGTVNGFVPGLEGGKYGIASSRGLVKIGKLQIFQLYSARLQPSNKLVERVCTCRVLLEDSRATLMPGTRWCRVLRIMEYAVGFSLINPAF